MNTTVPQFKQGLAELIASPSVSSVNPDFDQSNEEVINKLSNWFSDLGFAIEKIPVPDSRNKFNLVASKGTGEGGLLLAGHTDTVPFNEEQWHQDPFLLTERNDRLHGLGTSDMKSFFPLVMEAIRKLDNKKLHQPLYILATADEESTMSGARALQASGMKLASSAVIGEPTGLVPVRMHKGVLMEAITVTGQAGHSSNPALGKNALEGMHRVISALMKWRQSLEQEHCNNQFNVPVPTLNFGSIKGGDNPNRICASCVMTIDIRLLPGMQLETIRQTCHKVVNDALNGTGMDVHIHSMFGGVPPFETARDSEIVRVAESVCEKSAGAVTFGTEAPFLNDMGMQTIILGPGDIDQAHQANEYIELNRIQPMIDIVYNLIGHFCLSEKNNNR